MRTTRSSPRAQRSRCSDEPALSAVVDQRPASLGAERVIRLKRVLNPVFGLAVLAVAPLVSPSAQAVERMSFGGSLAGRVADNAGVPQMGAAVLLYNKFDRLVSRLVTNDKGSFEFGDLLPDTYTIRVSLASFVPALRRNIAVQPGMRSMLNINLSSMLSSVELVYMAPGRAPVMSEDWKWVLRSAQSTRPVLRMQEGRIDISDPAAPKRVEGMFADTRGIVRLSSGEAGDLAYAGTQTDLGTAFAVATTLFGVNQLQVSGNLGYASNNGIPTAGFRTSLTRSEDGYAPAVNVTMRQIFLPSRVGTGLLGGQGGLPALQTMTVTFQEKRQLADTLELQYGSSLESVSFLNRLNYLSPFARLRWGTAEGGAVELAYSSGAPATELLSKSGMPDAELQHQLNTLSVFPRVSMRGGNARVQRAENFEMGYRREIGGRIVSVSAFRESLSNAALTMAGPEIPVMELLPDLGSNSSFYNIGRFRRMGYTAAISQDLGDGFSAAIGYGYAGGIEAPEQLLDVDPAELRSALRRAWRHSLTARMSGRAPVAGTRFMASYQATDYRVLQPVHLSLTQRSTVEPGLNVHLRQPIPLLSVKGSRLEASAELRNLLAQGYLPVQTNGTRILLIQSPRAVRGGVSLIF